MAMTVSEGMRRAREFAFAPRFARQRRYVAVSVVSTLLTLVLFYLFFRIVKIGSAVDANIVATSISTVPGYYLNRTWAWGKSGRSHLMREVVPFWVIAAVSLVLSTLAVGAADHFAKSAHLSHVLETVTVIGANLVTYGVIWVGKFMLFNKVLFVERPGPPAPEPAYASSAEAP